MNKELQELQKQITHLQEKQDLIIEFIYGFFYNHYELMTEDDLGRLNALINYKE